MYFDGCVHIEEDDQCFTCTHFVKGVSCPLLEALATGVVTLQDDVGVKNCGFYKKHVCHLSVLGPPKESIESDEDNAGHRPSSAPSKVRNLRR